MINWKRLTAAVMVSIMCVGTAITSYAADEDNAGVLTSAQENVADGQAESTPTDTTPTDDVKGDILQSDDESGNGIEDNANAETLQDDAIDNAQQSTVDGKSEQTVVSRSGTANKWWLEVSSGAFYSKENNMVYRFTSEKVSSEVQKILDNQAKLKEILSTKYIVDSKDTVVLLGSEDFELIDAMPAGGVDMRIWVPDISVDIGEVLYVLHQKHDGTWEVLSSNVFNLGGDISVSVHLYSLSPIALVKVMSPDGSIKELKEKPVSATAGNNKERKSPKTGDFF